ncbi:MAG TPA: cupin domain-containing protein [Bacteroidales bacterium]|jgi:quercetin dioxygenase-like cupin family protein
MPVFKRSESAPERVSPVLERRLVNLDNLMVVVCDFSNGPWAQPEKPHNHPHEQITYVAKGELYFFIGDEKNHLTEGDLVTIPSGVFHTIQTISKDVRLIDTFTPVRSDFLKKG